MRENSLKKNIFAGLAWKFSERIITQGISFLISLILARILDPENYGTVSLVLVFVSIANAFIVYGFGEALIQKKEADDIDFSTAFFLNLLLSFGLYFILFFAAHPIAEFYNDIRLVSVIRVLALQIPLSSVKSIQHAFVSKKMMFRKFFFSTLGGTIVSGVIGIIMAYKGFGVWALVEQYIVNSVIDMTVLFFTVKWRPHLEFDKESAKSIFCFGWKLMLSGLINVTYDEIRSLVIGKKFSKSDLAFYNKGNQFPSLVISNINTSVSSVLFPALCTKTDDKAQLKEMTRLSMKLTSYLVFPVLAGFFVVARPMISILLTDKWIECVPFLKICCAYWAMQPIQTANFQTIKACGRTDICLKMEIIKKSVGMILLFISILGGVYYVALSSVFSALFSMILNMIAVSRLIDYKVCRQIADMIPNILITLIMSVLCYSVSFLIPNKYLLLLCQVLVGVTSYLILSVVFGNDSFSYLIGFIKNNVKRNSE